MARQLQLLEQEPEWHLDAETRAVGRKGLEAARAALAAARATTIHDSGEHGHHHGDRAA